VTFDPRVTPMRPDLAAAYLEGKVAAARFVAGEAREVIDAQAPVREAPSPDAPLMTEVLLGERVTVYEFDDEAGRGANSQATAMSGGCRRAHCFASAPRRRTR
jgi:hypothetical protein